MEFVNIIFLKYEDVPLVTGEYSREHVHGMKVGNIAQACDKNLTSGVCQVTFNINTLPLKTGCT
jgi:hypothetical protein